MLSLRARRRVDIVLCAALGTLLPAAYGTIKGVPQPRIVDEFSYLLAADTFAHGRLTNPPPPAADFFEALHVLVTPTYSSKYPPAQGLALALGQVVFGEPIWGVWLSCGLFAGCLCWMLQAWTSRAWAFVTTIFAIVTLGVSTYWAQSYWGGMLAAAAGALLFGGMRRTVRYPRVGASLLMGLGVVLLASTRPFEGFVTCVPAALVLAGWLAGKRSPALSCRLKLWMLPMGAVLVAGAAGIATHNHAVTGQWSLMPYALHDRQYLHQGIFLSSARREPEKRPVPRLEKYYLDLRPPSEATGGYAGLFRKWAGRFFVRLPVTVESALGNLWAPDSYLTSQRGALLWLLVLVLTSLGRPWGWFCSLAFIFVVLATSFVRSWYPHYLAPIFPLVLAVTADALRRNGLKRLSGRKQKKNLPLIFLIFGCAYGVFLHGFPLLPHLMRRDRMGSTATEAPSIISTRYDVIRLLAGEGGSHLVFIQYDQSTPPGNSNEWVYNGAVPGESLVVFAHDLGTERNRELIAQFGDRRVWRMSISPSANELVPFPDHDQIEPAAP
ncbi:MAG: hypothetical protein ACT4QC_22440 [Planctomycetaceae bacterium]